MFNKKYEQRLAAWHDFRQELETAEDPIASAVDFYRSAPIVSIHTDPYDKSRWPDPWELVNENQYCDFCILLGICYSLQLTDRFSESSFEIHIAIDRANSATYYLLYVDNIAIGWNETYVEISDLPQTVVSQKVYAMPKLQ